MPCSILSGVTVIVVAGAGVDALLLRLLRIQQMIKVIKVTVNKTLRTHERQTSIGQVFSYH